MTIEFIFPYSDPKYQSDKWLDTALAAENTLLDFLILIISAPLFYTLDIN